MAWTIKQKTGEEVYKTLSKASIKEYVGLGVERMSVMEKGDSRILLMDQTMIVVPAPVGLNIHSIGHTVKQKQIT